MKCPKCGSTNINQYRQTTGKIWCQECGFTAPEKGKYNPFVTANNPSGSSAGDYSTPWRDAKKEDPPYSEHGKSYLVILKSNAKSNHCKKFAGLGHPEIATWCNNYDSPYKWNCRGTLAVAYWMPLPRFDKEYVLNEEGSEPKWV